VTDLLPTLVGRHRFRATVTAGADQKGLAAGTRAGWNVEASLVLTPGQPERRALGTTALAFVPRLARAATAPMGTAAPPPGATRGRIDAHASGHGAVGAGVCDEFCQKTLEVQVGGQRALAEPIWKSCADNCEVAAGSAQRMGQHFDYRCADRLPGERHLRPRRLVPRAEDSPPQLHLRGGVGAGRAVGIGGGAGTRGVLRGRAVGDALLRGSRVRCAPWPGSPR